MIGGSCLCGAIAFEFDPAGVVLSNACYCINCRKVSGSQFGVYLQVREKHFHWLYGDDNVATYESTPGNKRGFCRTCGCIAPIATYYGAIRVPAGALDDDPGMAPDAVLHTDRKAEWCTPDKASHVFADSGPQDFWRRIITQLYSP